MLTYEVQYKCYLSEFYDNLPFICYKYRRRGKVFWEKKKQVCLDLFASKYWRDEYYDEDLIMMPAYNRVRIMREILDKEYNGSLKDYVKAMVEFEIMSDLIDKEEYNDTRKISLSFVTGGWVETTVKLKRKEYGDEKLD